MESAVCTVKCEVRSVKCEVHSACACVRSVSQVWSGECGVGNEQ